MNPLEFSQASQTLKSSAVRDLLRFAHQPDVISLAGGMPATELFDVDGIQAAIQTVLAQPDRLALQYGATEGQSSLHAAIRHLMQNRAMQLNVHRVLVTSGSQQGLDLIARALLNPGDAVILERPNYLAAIQVFNLAQAQFIELETDEHGAKIEMLDALCAAKKPKLIYLVSNFSNPTGASLALERRKHLIRWATKNKVLILEDDPYGELRFRGNAVPPLLSLAESIQPELPDAKDYCIYAGSLSKIIAPGLRLGWLVLPNALFDTVARIKQAADLQTSSFTQEIAAAYLNSGRLAPHIEKICAHYYQRQLAMLEALRRYFGDLITFNEPEGGMFIWATFKAPVNTQSLLEIALKKGVIFVPGHCFYPTQAQTNALRLSYVSVASERLLEGVRRLREAYDELITER